MLCQRMPTAGGRCRAPGWGRGARRAFQLCSAGPQRIFRSGCAPRSGSNRCPIVRANRPAGRRKRQRGPKQTLASVTATSNGITPPEGAIVALGSDPRNPQLVRAYTSKNYPGISRAAVQQVRDTQAQYAESLASEDVVNMLGRPFSEITQGHGRRCSDGQSGRLPRFTIYCAKAPRPAAWSWCAFAPTECKALERKRCVRASVQVPRRGQHRWHTLAQVLGQNGDARWFERWPHATGDKGAAAGRGQPDSPRSGRCHRTCGLAIVFPSAACTSAEIPVVFLRAGFVQSTRVLKAGAGWSWHKNEARALSWHRLGSCSCFLPDATRLATVGVQGPRIGSVAKDARPRKGAC